MAQPTQDFPPWLAPSAVVITDAAGDPVTTSTTILYLPPTYFGPSIPLGSLYSFGGSSEPATVVLPSPTPQTITTTLGASTTTATTTTAAPTTSVSLSTTSATPTTTSSLLTSVSSPTTSVTPTLTSLTSASSTTPSSVSLTTSLATPPTSFSSTTSFSTSSTPLPTSGPVAATGLSRGQLVGVIVASILGVIFLFVLALFFFLWYKGRRNRRQFTSLSPIDDDYYVVPPGGRTPGEGSPRHSGEEADPFLQERSHGHGATVGETSAAGAAAGMAQVAGHGASRPYSSSRVPPPVVGSGSSGSTDSNASGFGELLPTQSLSLLPSQQALENRQSGASQPSSGPIDPMNQGHVVPEGQDQYEDGEYTGAYAYSQDPMLPPRLLDPDTTFAPLLGAFQPPKPPSLSHQPSFQDAEAAEVYTAQRFRAEDLAPRSSPQSEAGPSHRGSSGLLGSLGLGVLANIGRRSWFKQFDSPRNSASYSPTYTAEPLSERDIETGRSVLMTPDRLVDSFGNRPRGTAVGFYADDTRPISTTSGRSGNSNGTTYHDAQTSLPGTPHIAPLPRALTPSEPPHLPPMPMLEHTWLSSPLAGPPAYEDPFSTPSRTGSPGRRASPPVFTIGTPEVDVLDMPAPTALNRFASISSLKEMTTGTSTGSGVGTSTKGTPFPPPGLETVRPVGSSGWGTSSSVTASPAPGSFAFEGMGGVEQQGLRQHAAGITFDVLEDAPPDAEQGWRSMAMARAGGGLVGDTGRRGTFGLYVHGVPEFMSEQGSLHSMRSHFSPSNRSTGSAPASRHGAGSLNSTSSRPSAHSAASSAASAMHSLGRTGSIGSENRKRLISPALSAFGLDAYSSSQRRASSGGSGSGTGGSHSQSGSGSNGSNGHEPALPPIIGSLPLAHTSGLREMTSGSTMAMDADTSFGSSTVRCGPQSRNPSPGPSPLSVSFPLTAPWVGGLDDAWQPTA